ncbi:ankyrin repeat and SOCS box protein 10 [Procambarus clarkii]|uniref:ankyrin repeat and SOCS box protein 10 n=1 Tax=Procambarus clarkii TaxID=6728 RepID=UPI001E672549|nr:ankyrin repeat and SOCS box protein 11-like [Procambarus clarkii]XP_045600207.1 ankyrin repeat and SOCS box protein 11-like [Procambarus clarkii]XP_045600208.1 ankyrin repeat and SOCS box protein 11-like [Procambarus clarkii]XP_045600209.1 ankyrin repeat and SOCS box protein 11-like [Procambarus clarkii]
MLTSCNVASSGVLGTASPRMGRTPHILDLHQAIVTGDMDEMVRLAESGLDMGCPVRGTTALSLAVYRGDLHALRVLAQAGAPLDRRSKDHLERLETPIISAIRLGHREIFQELVRRGARLDLRDFYNQTPLWFAVKEQRLGFVRILLKNGAPIDFTRAAENPLNIAMQFLGYRGRREMALELVAAGVPLTLEDYKGHSPLYWAMKHVDFEFFRLLVEAGAPLREYEWLAPPHLPRTWQEDADILEWLTEESKTPPPLKRQCRTFIYATLRVQHKTDVRPLVQALTLGPQLPLPQLLLSYLLLEVPLRCATANPPLHNQAQGETVPPPAPLPL